MTSKLADAPVNEWRTKALIREFVRSAVAKMMARQEAPFDEAESVAYQSSLEQQRARIVAAQRSRDWSLASELGASTAPLVGLQPDALVHPVLARELLAQARALLDSSLQVERECDDPLSAARSVLEDVGLKPERSSLKPPMLLSTAIDKAAAEASTDVEKKIRAVGDLALAFFGDVPVATLSQDQVFDFLHFVWNMPKDWGQRHGKNRYNRVGSGLNPLQIKRDADAEDEALLGKVLSDQFLTTPEKRFQLVQELRPRIADGYLIVQRDMFNRIVRAALGSAAVGRDLNDEDRVVPSHSQLKQKFHLWHKNAKTECGLPRRISRPKRRRSWSIEHLVKLFLSPLYVGTSSLKQRWRKATAAKRHVVRDALYWVPLFMITLGVRPEEILQLKVKNVRHRDGVICLFLGDDLDEQLKADQSRRVLPVPQLLLDLGFREWIIAKRRAGEIWAFSDVAPSEADGRRSQIFGNRLRTYLNHLKLKFSDEDIYAMRRTLSSKLLALKVDTGVRQRILGHLEGTTVDRYYSDDGLPELKAQLDEVDYGVKVGRASRFAFPVIIGCSAPVLPSVDVTIWLTDKEDLCAIHLTDPDTDETILAARIDGTPLPKDDDARAFPVLSGEVVATQLLALQGTYTLTLPACEASVAAVEHMLILADPPMHPRLEALPDPEHAAKSANSVTAPALQGERQPDADEQCEAERGSAAGYEVGDTAICVFPLKRRGNSDGQPRPGLVVGVRTMNGRRYLDIAQGSRAQPKPIAPHLIAVNDQDGLSLARIKMPTCFDLRRRILVAEDDTLRIHRPLGMLADTAKKRLREALGFVGDISPEPLCERRPTQGAKFQVERRSRKAMKPERSAFR